MKKNRMGFGWLGALVLGAASCGAAQLNILLIVSEDYRHLQKEGVALGQRTDGFRWRDHYWTGEGKIVDTWLEGDDSRIVMDRALPFIRESGKAGTPFFAVIWFHTPHTPLVAGDADREAYADQPIEAQHWFGAITAMDREIGRLRAKLREWALAEDTIVWFCSDNGPSYIHDFNSAGALRGKKATLWEGGIRIPAIVEWPARWKTTRTLEAPVSTSDFYPTLLAAAGLPLPANQPVLDGENVLPILDGMEGASRSPIAFQAPLKRTDNPFAEPGSLQMALVGERYKLTSFDGGKTYQLFDLREDVAEVNDVSGDHPERVRMMSRRLHEWRRSCKASAQGEDYN